MMEMIESSSQEKGFFFYEIVSKIFQIGNLNYLELVSAWAPFETRQFTRKQKSDCSLNLPGGGS